MKSELCQKCNLVKPNWIACFVSSKGPYSELFFYGFYCQKCYEFLVKIYSTRYARQTQIPGYELLRSGKPIEELLEKFDHELVTKYNPINYGMREWLY
jgi:hypothetical protein